MFIVHIWTRRMETHMTVFRNFDFQITNWVINPFPDSMSVET